MSQLNFGSFSFGQNTLPTLAYLEHKSIMKLIKLSSWINWKVWTTHIQRSLISTPFHMIHFLSSLKILEISFLLRNLQDQKVNTLYILKIRKINLREKQNIGGVKAKIIQAFKGQEFQ